MSATASYMRSGVWTIDAIIRANEAAGGHFFGGENMRAFNSRVLGDVAEGPGGVYFVTSERGPTVGDRRRFYSVRRFEPQGAGVRTVRDLWQKNETPAGAWRHARRLAATPHYIPAADEWCEVCGHLAEDCTGATAPTTPAPEEAPRP